jgi:superfamily II DNA or RNA helicase
MASKKTSKEDAEAYEYLVVDHFHKEHPDASVWHWKDIPEDELWACGWIHDFNKHRMRKHSWKQEGLNKRGEYGLDGLARYGEGHFAGLQAKCWRPNARLRAADLGTFILTVEYRMRKENAASHGIVYHTCKLEANMRDDFKNGGVIQCVHLPFTQEQAVATATTTEATLSLYPHQKKALECLAEGWEGPGVLWMPPGTGKTVVFGHHVRDAGYRNIIILSPLQAQANQTLRRIQPFLDKAAVKVDCEADGTRDVQMIQKGLQNGTLFSSTYDSVDVLLEATEGICLTEDILIIDEAHNIIGNDDIRELMERFPKALLVSGTPPNRYFDNDKYEEPQILYHFPFREAIEHGYITDYLVYLPVLHDVEGTLLAAKDVTGQIAVQMEELPCVHQHPLAPQGAYLATAMLRTGARNVIAYMSSVEECKDFIKLITNIFEKFHAESFWGACITYEESSAQRDEALATFRASGEGFKILASVRILDEGIDIPECDGVFISKVAAKGTDRGNMRAIQRMCRAVRKNPRNPSKVAKVFVYADDDASMLNIFGMLKENDPEFEYKVRALSADYDRAHTRVAKDAEETVVENAKLVIVNIKDFQPKQHTDLKVQILAASFPNKAPKCATVIENKLPNGEKIIIKVGLFWHHIRNNWTDNVPVIKLNEEQKAFLEKSCSWISGCVEKIKKYKPSIELRIQVLASHFSNFPPTKYSVIVHTLPDGTCVSCKVGQFWSHILPNWTDRTPGIKLNEHQKTFLEQSCHWILARIQKLGEYRITTEDRVLSLAACYPEKSPTHNTQIKHTLCNGVSFMFKADQFWSSIRNNWSIDPKLIPDIKLSGEQKTYLVNSCTWLDKRVQLMQKYKPSTNEKLHALASYFTNEVPNYTKTIKCTASNGISYTFHVGVFWYQIQKNWLDILPDKKLNAEQKLYLEKSCLWLLGHVKTLQHQQKIKINEYQPSVEDKIKAFAACYSNKAPKKTELKEFTLVDGVTFIFKSGIFWSDIKNNWTNKKPGTTLTKEQMDVLEKSCSWLPKNIQKLLIVQSKRNAIYQPTVTENVHALVKPNLHKDHTLP